MEINAELFSLVSTPGEAVPGRKLLIDSLKASHLLMVEKIDCVVNDMKYYSSVEIDYYCC